MPPPRPPIVRRRWSSCARSAWTRPASTPSSSIGPRPAGPQGVVRAPIAGTVVEKLVTPGQLLQAGTTPCFTIAGLSSVWVMAHVFEAELPDVAVGDSAEVRLTDDTARVYRGRVTYVGALVNPDTRATDVRVLTANPGETLKRDMFVRVAIRAARPRTGLARAGVGGAPGRAESPVRVRDVVQRVRPETGAAGWACRAEPRGHRRPCAR